MTLKEHYNRVASLGCLACRMDNFGHVVPQLHHPYGRKGKKEWQVIPICQTHHQGGFNGGEMAWRVSVHPFKARFHKRYGSADELLEMVDKLLERI